MACRLVSILPDDGVVFSKIIEGKGNQNHAESEGKDQAKEERERERGREDRLALRSAGGDVFETKSERAIAQKK